MEEMLEAVMVVAESQETLSYNKTSEPTRESLAALCGSVRGRSARLNR